MRVVQWAATLAAPPASPTNVVNAGASRELPGLVVAPAWYAWQSPVSAAAGTALAGTDGVGGVSVAPGRGAAVLCADPGDRCCWLVAAVLGLLDQAAPGVTRPGTRWWNRRAVGSHQHLHVLRDHVISEPDDQHLYSGRCCDHRENPRFAKRDVALSTRLRAVRQRTSFILGAEVIVKPTFSYRRCPAGVAPRSTRSASITLAQLITSTTSVVP